MSFSPIIPLHLEQNSASDIREIRTKFGFRRFFCNYPGGAVPNFSCPDLRQFEQFAEKICVLKEQLKDLDVELNWWCAPSLNSNKDTPFQHIVNFDGTESETAACPLDEAFRKDFSSKIAAAAKIAHFPIIQFEDDFELSNHPGVTFGCFCPLHMAEFAKRVGKSYTREELVLMYKENKLETQALRRAFDELRRDSMVLLAEEIRKALDKVSPETRLSLCEPGTTDYDGDLVSKLPPALSGKNLRPLVRVYGSNYACNDSPHSLPWQLAHTMFSAERLPKEWELMHESDTCPHSRYFMSDTYLRALMTNAFSFGLSNSLFYACQYVDDPTEDEAYLRMGQESSAFFNGVIEASKEGHLDGIRILHSPAATSLPRLTPNGGSVLGDIAWIFARLGFPYSTRYGSPVVISGMEASVLSDEEIRSYLSGGVLLDAIAAEIFDQRGFSSLTGVKTVLAKNHQFYREELADIPDFAHIRGRLLYSYGSSPEKGGNSPHRDLIPEAGAEVMSYLTDPTGNKLQPAMCRFTNKLGGRVGVLSGSFSCNVSPNMLCYRKKQMLKVLLEWLRGAPLPACLDAPNAWVVARTLPTGMMMTLTSLTISKLRDIPLILGPGFGTVMEELGEDGVWRKADFSMKDGVWTIPELLPLCPRVFRIQK